MECLCVSLASLLRALVSLSERPQPVDSGPQLTAFVSRAAVDATNDLFGLMDPAGDGLVGLEVCAYAVLIFFV